LALYVRFSNRSAVTMVDKDLKRMLAEHLVVPVEIAGRAFGLSRGSAYQAVRTGQIPSVKIGGKFVVPTAPLRKMLGIDGGGKAA
jgi:hypothetical protein